MSNKNTGEIRIENVREQTIDTDATDDQWERAERLDEDLGFSRAAFTETFRLDGDIGVLSGAILDPAGSRPLRITFLFSRGREPQERFIVPHPNQIHRLIVYAAIGMDAICVWFNCGRVGVMHAAKLLAWHSLNGTKAPCTLHWWQFNKVSDGSPTALIDALKLNVGVQATPADGRSEPTCHDDGDIGQHDSNGEA